MTPSGGRPLVDEEARREVVEAIGSSFCVEAAAGTGKTSLLVERILHLLTSGIRASQLAAITFTELAAAELKARVRSRLEQSRHPAHRQALQEIESAQISTIHSLALAILKERPIEAGLDPGFETADPSVAAGLFEELWRLWLNEQAGTHSRAGPGETLLRLAMGAGLGLEELRGAAMALYDHRDVTLADPSAGARAAEALQRLYGALQHARDCVQEHGAELEALVKGACRTGEDELARAVSGFARALSDNPVPAPSGGAGASDEALPLAEALAWATRIGAALQKVKKPGSRLGAQKHWTRKEDLEKARELYRDVREAVEEAARSARQALAASIVAWLRGFVEWAQQEKKRRGQADFLDQLLWCRDLLRSSVAARRHFQQRWRAVLVDEFQDTDPLQAEIVFFLTEREPRAHAWRDVEVGPGRLFVVGDPKQSIYRFRRADIETYRDAASVLERQGRRATIRQNFRTVPAITRHVNAFFEAWMGAGRPALAEAAAAGDADAWGRGPVFQPAYVALEPYRPDEVPPGAERPPGAYRLLPAGSGGTGELSADETRRLEARLVAGALQHLVGEGRLQVLDGGAWRTARWRDAVVLLPVFTGIEHLESALERAGVPYRVVGGRLFYTRTEIREISLALSAVYNPSDALAVLGTLRSGFFGVSDAQLWAFHRAGGRLGGLRVDEGAARAAPRVAEALAAIGEWHRRWGTGRPAQVLRGLLDESGYLAWLRLRRDAGQSVANVDKLVAQVTALEQGGTVTLGGLVRWLRARGPGGPAPAEEEDSPLTDDEESVRILTVHKAKGLEFPIVFVANLGERRSDVGSAVVDRQAGRIELRLGRSDLGIQTAGFEEAVEQEKRRLRAERVRLYYVALTRARDYLFLSGLPRDGGFWKELSDVAGQAAVDALPAVTIADGEERDEAPGGREAIAAVQREAAVSLDRQGEGPEEADDPERMARRWLEQRQELLRRASQGRAIVAARSLRAPAWREDTVAGSEWAEAVQGEEVPASDALVPAGDDDGTALGLAFHQVMEWAAREGFPTDPGWARTKAEAAATAWRLGRGQVELLAQWVAQACRGPVGALARRSARCMAEVPFAYVDDAGTLVEGRMDLLCVLPGGGLVVVDYKTDAAPASALRKQYAAQAEAYAQAARRACGAPAGRAVDVFLYAARAGQLVVPEGAGREPAE
ncbi:MAG: UvrD-helicase domain-containing protein [Limnochordaceae bacterium]|nr:UvrD-helicase domain-containing protein [Limnochordaceae bacterium]